MFAIRVTETAVYSYSNIILRLPWSFAILVFILYPVVQMEQHHTSCNVPVSYQNWGQLSLVHGENISTYTQQLPWLYSSCYSAKDIPRLSTEDWHLGFQLCASVSTFQCSSSYYVMVFACICVHASLISGAMFLFNDFCVLASVSATLWLLCFASVLASAIQPSLSCRHVFLQQHFSILSSIFVK